MYDDFTYATFIPISQNINTKIEEKKSVLPHIRGNIISQLQVDDFANLLATERLEDDRLIDSIEKLGQEPGT